jgi:hypothetical protein
MAALSIEGNNGIGILKATNGCTIEVVLDKGRQNKLLATDQEGFTYKLYLVIYGYNSNSNV